METMAALYRRMQQNMLTVNDIRRYEARPNPACYPPPSYGQPHRPDKLILAGLLEHLSESFPGHQVDNTAHGITLHLNTSEYVHLRIYGTRLEIDERVITRCELEVDRPEYHSEDRIDVTRPNPSYYRQRRSNNPAYQVQTTWRIRPLGIVDLHEPQSLQKLDRIIEDRGEWL